MPMANIRTAIICILTTMVSALLALPTSAAEAGFGVGQRQVTWIDETRGIKKTSDFAGAATRRLDVIIWYPTKDRAGAPVPDAPIAPGGPWPLVIYSHGTNGRPDNAMHIVNDLVHHGYIVAAPTYPLSSPVAFTQNRLTDPSDVINQVKDIPFMINRLLADPVIGSSINPNEIGITGHSLGAVTSYFSVYGASVREPRVKAMAMIAGGDPVQAALSSDMGMQGTQHAEVSVPALFLTGEKDIFNRITGRPYAAFARVEGPKYQVMISRGVHTWFRDGEDQPAGNKNPDCLFFERYLPNRRMPGCEERVPLIDPRHQQAITRNALRSFFDGYLKHNEAALSRLKGLGHQDRAVSVRFER